MSVTSTFDQTQYCRKNREMKYCPLRGIICEGEKCAWYRKGDSHRNDDCAVLVIATAIDHMDDWGIILQEP